MLQLVVDNTKREEKQSIPTCRTHCELFDPITEQCGISKDVNVDDSNVAVRCAYILPKDEVHYFPSELEESEVESTDTNYILTEEIIEPSDSETFYKFNGDKFVETKSKYPLEPDYPANRDDAIWYVSPDQEFGCWIINRSKYKFIEVNSKQNVNQGWHPRVYQSPFPLHNHKASLSIASNMTWYVDEDGYGQYVFLHDGKIGMVSSTRPKGWTPKK